MIDERSVMQKLEEQAQIFKVHADNKRYMQAKRCYETARTVVVFMELEPKKEAYIFGVQGERGVILQEGLFKKETVMKVLYEVDVKRQSSTYTQKNSP